MKLEDLPPTLRAQAERQLGLPSAESRQTRENAPSCSPKPLPRSLVPYIHKTRQKPPVRSFGKGMNKTEAAYQREVLGGTGRFEPITFHLLGGCRYTPDFLTIDDGVPTFHEVKGSYRLESEGRAWTAFNSAAAQYPFFRWIWAVKGKKREEWTIKRRIDPDAAE